MKKLIAFATLTLLSLCADYHDPSIAFGVDNRDTKFFYQIHLDLQHQSTIELDDCNAIILHGLSQSRSNKTFHHEIGVGYRRMYEDFGFGTNILYANQYAHSFFSHNLVPGVELFYQHFMLTYNRYLPIITSVQIGNEKYLFHDVSEITLSYRPSKKYEFSIAPYYNHQTNRLGYAGSVSAFVFDNVQLTLTPYCEPQVQHGVALSVGYHFGGATDRVNRKLAKSHRFFYTSKAEEVKKYTPGEAPVVIPASVPIVLNPVEKKEEKKEQKQEQKQEEKKEQKQEEKGTREATWVESILGVKAIPGDK